MFGKLRMEQYGAGWRYVFNASIGKIKSSIHQLKPVVRKLPSHGLVYMFNFPFLAKAAKNTINHINTILYVKDQ